MEFLIEAGECSVDIPFNKDLRFAQPSLQGSGAIGFRCELIDIKRSAAQWALDVRCLPGWKCVFSKFLIT